MNFFSVNLCKFLLFSVLKFFTIGLLNSLSVTQSFKKEKLFAALIKMKKPNNSPSVFICFFILILGSGWAQVVTYTPQFPSTGDSITIIFDASKGNGALLGVSPVFAHTGVISNKSNDLGDWQHQVSLWNSGFDSTILMQPLGNNKHQLKIHINNFYGINNSIEKVRELVFVFRDSLGTVAGKNSDGTDILIPVFGPGYDARFISPLDPVKIISIGNQFQAKVKATQNGVLNLFHNGTLIAQSTGDSVMATITASANGKFWLYVQGQNGGNTVFDSIFYIVQPPVTVQNSPAGIKDGINYINDSTVVLQLLAPLKTFAYLIGDFNNWQMDPAFLMKRTPDGERYWIQLNGIIPGMEYRYQYLVDSKVKIADMWAEKVLDPDNDGAINPVTYPNLIPYPKKETTEFVSVFQTGQQPYQWNTTNFQRPDNRDLVIYELLIRDFIVRHDYLTLKDTISYFKKLGINAIELMPVMEFDGNQNWGYGPAFWIAPDKYYGPKKTLQQFIDSCHANGIAVILDIVFNHAFENFPYVKLYFDKGLGKVTPQNPWFNVAATHPFSVGHDFNHDSPYTRNYMDSVLTFWTSEYKVDGFRFDLSKGFTQFNSGTDVGLWGQYDGSRIYNIKRMLNHLWSVAPGTFGILEHFADNAEETELANFGALLWGKANYQYNQATMGYQSGSDFEWYVSYKERGWAYHNLVGFMESHDEERLMFNNAQWGNVNGNYSTKDLSTSLERMAQAAAFFFTIPGPKMLWQFGELGYDYSIDYACRTCPKPIKWNYYTSVPDRLKLFKTYAALIKLKTNYPAFRTSNYDVSSWGIQKQIYINDPSMNVCIFGNFDVSDQNTYTGFQHTGKWYEYFSGDSLDVTNTQMTVILSAGEFRIFTDTKLPLPDLSIPVLSKGEEIPELNFAVFPNPMANQTEIRFSLEKSEKVLFEIFDVSGNKIRTLENNNLPPGNHSLFWDGANNKGVKMPAGIYYYTGFAGNFPFRGKLVIMN